MYDPNGSTDVQLIDAIGVAEASISKARRAQLRAIREFDLREAWAHDGARHMGQWLAAHLGITVSEGLRRTTAAHALEDLPMLSDALERGVLSLEKTCQLARYLEPDSEADEIRWAQKARFDHIKRKADVANRPTLDDVRGAEAARYLNLWECDELGNLGIDGRLPAAEGALFKKAIERAAATVPTMPDEEPDPDRHKADALLALTIGGAGPARGATRANDPDPGAAEAEDAVADADASDDAAHDIDPDRATVVVHVDLEALIDRDRGAEIVGGPVIAPEIASELLCDCRLQVVVNDALDRAVGIGHESRIVPRWLRRQLKKRDRGCTFPGCSEKFYLDAHHIIWWEHGGPTQLDNLTMVCHYHHKLIHQHGWGVVLDVQQRAQWHRPDGTPYEPKVKAPRGANDEDPQLEPAPTVGQNVRSFPAERLRAAWVRAPGFG